MPVNTTILLPFHTVIASDIVIANVIVIVNAVVIFIVIVMVAVDANVHFGRSNIPLQFTNFRLIYWISLCSTCTSRPSCSKPD